MNGSHTGDPLLEPRRRHEATRIDWANKSTQVTSVVAFLFTDGASAINGATIPVEDGFQIFKNS